MNGEDHMIFTPATRIATPDIVWLKGVFFLFILLFAVPAIQKGLLKGDAIFDMNDVKFAPDPVASDIQSDKRELRKYFGVEDLFIENG